MQLFFLRHGLADWPEWDTARDHERPLTDAGMAKLKEEARRIEGLGVRPDAIVTSPLVRARQTADIVAKQLRVEVAEDITLAPGFNAKKLGDVLGRHADAGAILLVGHEPDFSRTIAQVTGGRITLKKGGLARVDLDTLEPPKGTLVWLLPPRALTA